MAQYGQLLDTGVLADPIKDEVYSVFSKYFENLTMTKIKDVEGFSMYVAKIRSGLNIEHRYVIIFVENDKLPLGNMDKLINFQWVNLQTRSLYENHNLQPQTYRPRRMPELMVKIRTVNRNNDTFRCEKYPLEITMLPRKKGEMEYQPEGNIIKALETYNTIVSFV